MITAPSEHSHRRAGKGLVAVDVLIALTLLVALLSWFFDPFKLWIGPAHLTVGWGFKPALVPVVLLVVRIVLASRGGVGSGLLARVSLAIGTALVVVVSLEGVLGLLGVPRGSSVFEVTKQDGEPIQGSAIVFDHQLLWRFKPGAMFNGRRVNAMGYLDREGAEEKADRKSGV